MARLTEEDQLTCLGRAHGHVRAELVVDQLKLKELTPCPRGAGPLKELIRKKIKGFEKDLKILDEMADRISSGIYSVEG